MPWRLIFFLVALALFVIFAGLNVGNQTDISFGFYTFKKIPIFISLFIAFLLGALVVLPFSFRRRRSGSKDGSNKAAKEPTKKESYNEVLDAKAIGPPPAGGEENRLVSERIDSTGADTADGAAGKKRGREKPLREKKSGRQRKKNQKSNSLES